MGRVQTGQVFSNLIGNALQYSPPGSTVHLRVEGHNDHVRIIVQNSGYPIPPDKIRSLFEPLSRGNAPETGIDASDHLGLGLFIARKIVAAHGGELNVTSNAADGTTFTAELPR